MYFESKKTAPLILGITSIVCSRAMFFFFDDPEGPNLVVVLGMAAIVYFSSLVVYSFKPVRFSFIEPKKLVFVFCIQVLIVVGLYFCLR